MTENKQCKILFSDDGVYILKTENYIFHLDVKTHVEKIGELISENEQLKSEKDYWKKRALLLEKTYNEGDSAK